MGFLKDIQPAHLILGSASPRRKALMEAMGFSFEVRTQECDEHFPEHLIHYEITDYLCELKALQLLHFLKPESVLLTADTIVWQHGKVLGKPLNKEEAVQTLKGLSGAWHEVITSVCFATTSSRQIRHEVTRVRFATLEPALIEAYMQLGEPLDKAGAYGIQEWIGLVGIEAIEGSYTNVVGLPTRLVYETLRDMGMGRV
ncbi:MAG TPA: Maf family nucleotide pyrophosphatase [Robiginitalea sp.]|nr:Maf family nucleotide pyrophosphatase [Robiginitalea sp.]